MSNQANQSKAIYLKALKQWVPVTDEYYDQHRREIDAYIHRMRSHKCCRCPKNKWWLCDMDCWTCEFRCGSESASLDDPVGGDAEDITLGDTIADDSEDILSILADQELLARLFEALDQIDPTRSEICKLWAGGMTERDIAKRLGIKRQSTVNYQRNKALQELRELLNDLI